MLEELWNGLIQFSEQFVVPDWGSLVLLLPVLLAALVGLYLTWIVYRFATAAPTRRGIRRQTPVPPEGMHMPGPSFAPLLGAFGAFMLVFGLFAGGIWLAVGVVVLAITLLYWGREALRDYDHVATSASGDAVAGALPAPMGVPPAGVHIPAPSFRPLLVAIAMTILVAGLFVGGWALAAGVAALVVTLIGWLRDARREYVAVEAADHTGHLDPGGAPAWPKATFATLAVIIAAAIVLSSGVLPNSNSGTGAVPSGAPVGGGGGGEAPATTEPSLPAADVSISAENIAFSTATLAIPAGRPFTIAFDNKDSGIPHDIVIRDASGSELFKGDIVTGPKVVVYQVPAIPAGTYTFVCSVHPNMTGTVTAQ